MKKKRRRKDRLCCKLCCRVPTLITPFLWRRSKLLLLLLWLINSFSLFFQLLTCKSNTTFFLPNLCWCRATHYPTHSLHTHWCKFAWRGINILNLVDAFVWRFQSWLRFARHSGEATSAFLTQNWLDWKKTKKRGKPAPLFCISHSFLFT